MMPATWSKADIHIHTTVSDGVASPIDVLRWANEDTDLSVIAIADHNAVDGAIEASQAAPSMGRVEVVVAQEVESADGHIIGLWTRERISPGMGAFHTVAAIHDQGGLAVIAHPFAPRWWHRHGLCRGHTDVYDAVPFDAVEVANSTPLLFAANYRARLYQAFNRHRLAATGGSDAHIQSIIGTSWTQYPGTTAADLRRAIEDRATRGRGPKLQLHRGILYARHVPTIRERDAERKAREEAEGIR